MFSWLKGAPPGTYPSSCQQEKTSWHSPEFRWLGNRPWSRQRSRKLEKGFIEGPVEKESLPAGSTLTKRFPVQNKVRPIDDYKASLVNFAVSQTEGVTIHTIDHITAMTSWWMRSGSLSPDDALVAKCWDLSDAYKQVPLSDEAFDLDSYLAVFDPGASSAKKQRPSIRFCGLSDRLPKSIPRSVEDRLLSASHYVVSLFDDFLCLSRRSESRHVDFCVSALFSLLGWKVSDHKFAKSWGSNLIWGEHCWKSRRAGRRDRRGNEVKPASSERRGEVEGTPSVRKFTDVWKTFQKAAKDPFKPCHSGQTDFVWQDSRVPERDQRSPDRKCPKEDWIPTSRSGSHLCGCIIWSAEIQWPWGHGGRHVNEDPVFLQWSCERWHSGRNYVQRTENSRTRAWNDGCLSCRQVMAQFSEVKTSSLVYWQRVSQGFFPQDMVGQQWQRWHDQCHFQSWGGFWYPFVDRESPESEQPLGRFVKRGNHSFCRSRKSQSEPAGNLEVAGQVIQLWWSPQSPERGRKRGCGDENHRKFPIFKKKRECACLQGFTVHGWCTQVTWQLA